MGLVSDRNGVPVRASRRAAGSNASRHASPHDLLSPAWWISSRITRVLRCSTRLRCSIGRTPTPAEVTATPWYSLPSGPALYSGSSLIPIRAAASAHCFFRCSVGATTVICCTTWWCSSHDARVSANVVLPAPGVATARKSRGCSWMYLSIAPCCQARSLLAVPQGARPGHAGGRWCEAGAAGVVTVSVGGVGRAARLRRTTEPPYPGPSGRGQGPAGEPEGGTHLTVGARGGRCHPRGDRSRVVTHTPIRATAAMGRNTAAKAPGWEPVTSVATWVTVPPPRATKAAPPTARSSTLDSPSEIWRAAELVPASSGAESWS